MPLSPFGVFSFEFFWQMFCVCVMCYTCLILLV
jgi:hypothetical protein